MADLMKTKGAVAPTQAAHRSLTLGLGMDLVRGRSCVPQVLEATTPSPERPLR